MCVFLSISSLCTQSISIHPPSCAEPTGKMLSFLSDYIPNNLRMFAGEKLLFSASCYAL